MLRRGIDALRSNPYLSPSFRTLPSSIRGVSMRRVLVTGVTGFAGSHLVDYMLERGDCEIFGIQRWRSRTENIEHFADRISILQCDLRDASSTRDTLEKVRPNWIFHLA